MTTKRDESKTPAGQQKSHTATRTNPDTGATETREFTQAEWRARNKSEGWTRPDEDESEDEPEPPAPSGGTT
jgi:hypothetical protein